LTHQVNGRAVVDHLDFAVFLQSMVTIGSIFDVESLRKNIFFLEKKKERFGTT